MEIIGYIAFILMGLTLGMIGGGGAILTVPILVYLFGFDPLIATSYSLLIVGSTALIGGLSYLKKGDVNLKTGITFAVPGFFGVYFTRSFAVPRLPDPIFEFQSIVLSKPLLIMIVFALLMVAASISMIKNKKTEENKTAISNSKKVFLISIKGFFVGCVTGFVGAGGGFLIIPALVILVGLPMKVAVGTSLFIIATNSLIGFVGDLTRLQNIHQNIQWSFILSIVGIALAGLFIGMTLSKKVSDQNLKKGFGYFVLIMGTIILIDQLRRL